MKQTLNSKKGNVTVTWVLSLPLFTLIFLFIGSLIGVWMVNAAVDTAAEAGSLAATKKMDNWILLGLNDQINQQIPNTPHPIIPPGQIDDKELEIDKIMNEILKDENAKREFIRMLFEKHEEELKNEVREYVKRNGGQDHGWIIFPVNGRIEVKAKMPYHALVFSSYFQNATIEGTGYGPKRLYLELLPEKSIKIQY